MRALCVKAPAIEVLLGRVYVNFLFLLLAASYSVFHY